MIHIHRCHFIITQPKSWYSFYHRTEDRRLSRPRHCSKAAQCVPMAVYCSAVLWKVPEFTSQNRVGNLRAAHTDEYLPLLLLLVLLFFFCLTSLFFRGYSVDFVIVVAILAMFKMIDIYTDILVFHRWTHRVCGACFYRLDAISVSQPTPSKHWSCYSYPTPAAIQPAWNVAFNCVCLFVCLSVVLSMQ